MEGRMLSEGKGLPCTYLACHELESLIAVSIKHLRSMSIDWGVPGGYVNLKGLRAGLAAFCRCSSAHCGSERPACTKGTRLGQVTSSSSCVCTVVTGCTAEDQLTEVCKTLSILQRSLRGRLHWRMNTTCNLSDAIKSSRYQSEIESTS